MRPMIAFVFVIVSVGAFSPLEAADDYTIKPHIADCEISNSPPPQPRPVCIIIAGGGESAPIKESAKDAYTDNEIHINRDGSMTVCSSPVPLDAKCKPTRKGKVLFCERVTGTERCRVSEKSPDVGSSLSNQIELTNTNQTYRDDLAARTLAAEARQTLLDAKSFPLTPLIDNFGFLEPYSPSEVFPEGDISREVLAPKDRLEMVANDYDHLYVSAQQYISHTRENGQPLGNPLILANRGTLDTSSLVAQQHYMDDGTSIQYVRNIPIEQPLRYGLPADEMVIQPYSFPVVPIPNPGANQWGLAEVQPEQNISYSPGIMSRTWARVRSWFSW